MKDIEVYKFGGASIRTPEAIRQVGRIIQDFQHGPLVLVISAMGKTTNQLEALVNAHFDQPEKVPALMHKLVEDHIQVAVQLLDDSNPVKVRLNDLFVELEWGLDDQDVDQYDYVYDQVVAVGELLSSTLVEAYLRELGIAVVWVDARDLIQTDRTFRQAQVLWEETKNAIYRKVMPILHDDCVVLTQGFIGCTADNENTTLGREGSDYSAAILAHCLEARTVTVWKDVPGIMTGDPDRFDEVHKLDRMSFQEAIEMTYYGAKVLHPKTIKPLQNRQIPLVVRSFEQLSDPGTRIEDHVDVVYPPIVIIEEDQVMIQLSTRDYAFMEVTPMSSAFLLMARHGFKVNVLRNTAITLTLVTQNRPRHLNLLLKDLEADFTVHVTKEVWLITIRHTHPSTEEQLLQKRIVLLEERFKETVQFVTQALPEYAIK
ncbi:MAG: aspartate kinase [Saprospiraceae bacterium]|nr:aspartate kinase [Saprospiraceae bacterium]